MKKYSFLIIALAIKIGVSGLLHLFFSSESTTNPNVNTLDTTDEILLIVLAAPLFETLIFQFAVIELGSMLLAKYKYKNLALTIISAMLFTASHLINLFYLLHSFTSGLVLACTYFEAKKRDANAIASTFIVHSIFNFLSFFLNQVFT